MATNLPALPSVPVNLDIELYQLLSAVKTTLDSSAETLATAVSQAQLTTAMAIATATATATTAAATAALTDTTPPRALDNLNVNAGVLFNLLTWGTLPGNIDHINIYRAASDDRTIAALVGTSRYNIWSDYLPSGVSAPFYYWLRGVSKADVLGSWNLINGVVSAAGTSATPLGIGDNQVSTISANKIYALTLSALTANLGDVTAGTLKSGDRRFVINLVDKEIIIASASADPDNSWSGGNYIRIKDGSADTYVWNGSTHVLSKALNVIETGVASNGDTISLTKYYGSQPNIVVTPFNLQTYSAANSAQNQTLQVQATNIHETSTGSGSWHFDVTAQLALAANTSTTTPNEVTGPSASTPLTSSVYVTPANTTAISVSVDLTSIRGTGTAPNYYYRSVSFYIYVRSHGSGGAYTLVGSKTVALGATIVAVNSTLASSSMAANTWDVYVTATYADASGTFTSGSGGWDYLADVTVNLAADTAIVSATSTNGVVYAYPTATLPSFTPTAGYSVYNVNYTWSIGHFLRCYSGPYADYTYAQLSASSMTTIAISASGFGNLVTDGTSQYIPAATRTISYSAASYTTAKTLTMQLTDSSNSGGYAQGYAKFFAANTKAVIQQRKATSNSSTAANTLKFNSFTCTLSGASTLANGSLSWVSIL